MKKYKYGKGREPGAQLSFFTVDINIQRKLKRDLIGKLFRIVNELRIWIPFLLWSQPSMSVGSAIVESINRVSKIFQKILHGG